MRIRTASATSYTRIPPSSPDSDVRAARKRASTISSARSDDVSISSFTLGVWTEIRRPISGLCPRQSILVHNFGNHRFDGPLSRRPFESLDHHFDFHYAFRPPPRPYSRRHEKAVKRPQGSHKDSSERARMIARCTHRWRMSKTRSRVYSRIAGLPS